MNYFGGLESRVLIFCIDQEHDQQGKGTTLDLSALNGYVVSEQEKSFLADGKTSPVGSRPTLLTA